MYVYFLPPLFIKNIDVSSITGIICSTSRNWDKSLPHKKIKKDFVATRLCIKIITDISPGVQDGAELMQ